MRGRQPAPRRIAWGELVIPLVALAAAAVYWADAHDMPKPQLNLLLPRPVLVAIVALSLILICQVVFGRAGGGAEAEPLRRVMWRLGFAALTAAFLWLAGVIGFLAASVVFIAAVLVYLGLRDPRRVLLVAILGGAAIYAVFAYALSVPL